jgi:signal transduction histidine kinase
MEAHGAKAADMVLRILDGEKPASIPMLEGGTNVTMFDWRALRRWGIDENRLPPGAVVRFRGASFWELYRWHVAAAVAIIAAQAALIVALLVNRRRRRLAELEVQHQRSELAHASGLAVVGELTASIAHEINQPLGAILSNADAAELLLESGAPHEPIRHILEDIRQDDLRASEVIRRLRALLRKHEIETRPFDLNEAIADALRVVRAEAERRHVAVDAELAALPIVRGDRTHLQQVLLNLIVNGMDAMADIHVSRRRLLVRTARAGGDVEVSVTDAGHGIPAERMPRLFESFFSTKQHGMGLGLSIARSIVEAHGGRRIPTAARLSSSRCPYVPRRRPVRTWSRGRGPRVSGGREARVKRGSPDRFAARPLHQGSFSPRGPSPRLPALRGCARFVTVRLHPVPKANRA